MHTLRVSLDILTVDMTDDDRIIMIAKVNRIINVINEELHPDETEVQAFQGVSVEQDGQDNSDGLNEYPYGSDDEFLLNVAGDTCDCPACKARRAKNNQSRMN